jgi:hypothetical protein
MATDVSPAGIIQLGGGFWGSKTLLSAVELDVFTALIHRPLDGVMCIFDDFVTGTEDFGRHVMPRLHCR